MRIGRILIAAGFAVAVLVVVMVLALPRTTHYQFRGTNPAAGPDLRETVDWESKGDGPITVNDTVEVKSDGGDWRVQTAKKFQGRQHGRRIEVDDYFGPGTPLIGTRRSDGDLWLTNGTGEPTELGATTNRLVPTVNAG
jgi:hypothetical protein